MPTEQVRCENCGSSDVRQVAPNSYTCEHCSANFHWVDPTRTAVVHKSSVCKCGVVATAFCVRCQRPLCNDHRWGPFLGAHSYSIPDKAQCKAYCEEARKVLGAFGEAVDYDEIWMFVDSWGSMPSGRPQWVLELLKKRGFDPEDKSVFGVCCTECLIEDSEVWGELLGEVFAYYRQRIAEGKVCHFCLSEEVAGHCECGRALCSRHRRHFQCHKCHRLTCGLAACPGYIPYVGGEDSGSLRLCSKCRLGGCAGALLVVVVTLGIAGLAAFLIASNCS